MSFKVEGPGSDQGVHFQGKDFIGPYNVIQLPTTWNQGGYYVPDLWM